MPLYKEISSTLCKNLLTPFFVHCSIGVSSLLLLGVAFYMEYVLYLEPCPLCMLQRIVFFCIGLVSLTSALHRSQLFTKTYIHTIIALSIIGAALSIRHLYLQSLPTEELPACLPGLSYMLQTFPLADILSAMIMGTGECGDVLWTFLGLSIPGWTLIAFISIAMVNLLLLIKTQKVA